MKIPSSSPAVRSKPREFRADRIPAPKSAEDLAAAARVQAQITAKGGIDLEIGCGVGWHPIRYAVENPERAIVAIERTTEKFEKFRTRLARKPELTNLIAVHGDAVAWITHHIPDAACDRIFLFYPNPNPKNPQARWVRMPFFGHLAPSVALPAMLGVRYGARIIAVRVDRLPNARFSVVLERIAVADTGDTAADTLATTASIQAGLEAWIKADPGRWLWFYKRWQETDALDLMRLAEKARGRMPQLGAPVAVRPA